MCNIHHAEAWDLCWDFTNDNTPMDEGMTAFRTAYGSYELCDTGFSFPECGYYHGGGLVYPFGTSSNAIWEFDFTCTSISGTEYNDGLALCLHARDKHAQITFPKNAIYYTKLSQSENIRIADGITVGEKYTVKVEFVNGYVRIHLNSSLLYTGVLDDGVTKITVPRLNLSGQNVGPVTNNTTKWVICSHRSAVIFTGIRYKEVA